MLKQSHFKTPRTMDEAEWVEGYGRVVHRPIPWHLVRILLAVAILILTGVQHVGI